MQVRGIGHISKRISCLSPVCPELFCTALDHATQAQAAYAVFRCTEVEGVGDIQVQHGLNSTRTVPHYPTVAVLHTTQIFIGSYGNDKKPNGICVTGLANGACQKRSGQWAKPPRWHNQSCVLRWLTIDLLVQLYLCISFLFFSVFVVLFLWWEGASGDQGHCPRTDLKRFLPMHWEPFRFAWTEILFGERRIWLNRSWRSCRESCHKHKTEQWTGKQRHNDNLQRAYPEGPHVRQ